MSLPLDASVLGPIHMWIAIALIVFAMVAYASEKIAMEVTSIVIIALLLVVFHFMPVVAENGENQLDAQKLLSGFANPALISVLALLVLGQAIIQTGALSEVANMIMKVSRNRAWLSLGIAFIFVMVVSAFLNNTPVVVIFIPIMAALAKHMDMSVSKVMIPLSYISILGGMTTLIGSSTNLLVSGTLRDLGLEPLSFFEFTPIAAMMAVVGFFYVTLIAPYLLKDRATLVSSLTAGGEDDDRQFIAQIEVEYGSNFVGQALEDGKLNDYPNVNIRMIQRGDHAFLPPFDENMVIKPLDILVLAAPRKDLTDLFTNHPDLVEHIGVFMDRVEDEKEGASVENNLSMAEIVVAPASRLIGRTLEQVGFHSHYHCVVLGIQRQSRVIRSRLTEIRLAAGDVLLIMGARDDVMALQTNRDVLLMEWSTEDIHMGKKAGYAIVTFLSVIALAAFNIMPIVISALLGVAAVILFGCINVRQAVRSLDLKIMLLVAASLALGAALQETGGALYLARQLIDLMEGTSTFAIMSALFIFMAIVTNVLSNNAAAVLFTPIVVSVAEQLGVDQRIFIYALIFACNCSFATPIGYQTNLLVMGPGHYMFKDFLKAGIPLVFIMWLSYSAIAHWFFSF